MDALLARAKRSLVSNLPPKPASGDAAAPSDAPADKSPVQDAPIAQKSKYMRRGDAQRALEDAGLSSRPTVLLPRPPVPPAAASAPPASETDSSSAPVGLTRPLATAPTALSADGTRIDIGSIDVKRMRLQLRLLGQPIRYFAETVPEAYERLRVAQLRRGDAGALPGAASGGAAATGSGGSTSTGTRTGGGGGGGPGAGGGGGGNEMHEIRKAIEKEVEEELARLGGNSGTGDDAAAAATSATAAADASAAAAPGEGTDSSSSAATSAAAAAAAAAAARAERYSTDRAPDSFQSEAAFILFTLKRWLWLWERALASRPRAEAVSVVGRAETAKLMQTEQFLKPLLTGLRQGGVEADIVKMLWSIVALAREREYLRAHEEYLVLSIGNAAWPMGVTAVGIHARAGRERLASNQVAHILNDETKRKYIQGVKRLLSFAQTKFPPDDPAKLFVL